MRPGTWAVAIVVIAVTFVNLGAARLWDRDEPRNAQCAREMMEAGDWIVPTFDGELRTHKPALLYWGQIAAYKTFGVSEFSARVPSASAGLVTILLVFLIARRLSDEATANWAALILGTMLLFVMAARAATPDSLLIMTTTAVIAMFVFFAMIPAEGRSTTNFLGFSQTDGGFHPVLYRWPSAIQWAAIHGVSGVAVLAKGPVGFVMPMTIIGATLWALRFPGLPSKDNSSDQQGANTIVVWGFYTFLLLKQAMWIAWKMRPLTSIGMLLIVAGPWYIAVGIATDGEWLREFFLTHNYSRAVSSMEGHGGPPFLYYAGAFLVGTFPWSCFAIPLAIAVFRGIRDHQRPPLLTLGVIWISVFIAVFSFAATKLPSYISPSYPGAALVFGWYFRRLLDGKISQPRWTMAALSTSTLVGAATAIALSTIVAIQLPNVRSVGVAGILLATGGILGISFLRRMQPGESLRAFVVGAIGFTGVIHIWGPAAADRSRNDLDAIQAAVSEASPTKVWYSELPVEPSWVFYSNARIRPVSDYVNSQSQTPLAPKSEGLVGFIDRATEETPAAVAVFLKPQYFKIWDDTRELPSRIAREEDSKEKARR